MVLRDLFTHNKLFTKQRYIGRYILPAYYVRTCRYLSPYNLLILISNLHIKGPCTSVLVVKISYNHYTVSYFPMPPGGKVLEILKLENFIQSKHVSKSKTVFNFFLYTRIFDLSNYKSRYNDFPFI